MNHHNQRLRPASSQLVQLDSSLDLSADSSTSSLNQIDHEFAHEHSSQEDSEEDFYQKLESDQQVETDKSAI